MVILRVYGRLDSFTGVLAGIKRCALSYLGVPDATIHLWPNHGFSLEHYHRIDRARFDDSNRALRERAD